MSHKTDVGNLDNNEEDDEDEEIPSFNASLPSQQVRKHALDLFLPLEHRLLYLLLFHEQEPEQFGEIVSCITGMLAFSRTVSLKQYVTAIARHDEVPLLHRIDCARSLDDTGYDILVELCRSVDFVFLPTPIRVDTVRHLMKFGIPTKPKELARPNPYRLEAREFFCSIVNDVHIECLFRFRLIQSLEHVFPNAVNPATTTTTTNPVTTTTNPATPASPPVDSDFYFYANEASRLFVQSPYNYISYRVIACQYIFQKCEPPLYPLASEFLLAVAADPDIDEDIRADACDILLAYGTPEYVENARIILFVLGGGERVRHNVFKNAQNVHTHAIESSVEKLIEFILTYVPRHGGTTYTFEKAKEEIEERIAHRITAEQDILNAAIVRIVIDRAMYGRLHVNLAQIVTRMWTYIQDSDYRTELEQRLLEELIDSHNKCSSGYVSRIVNTLSGFGEMSVQIGFEDQIVAVLETRLNKKVQTEDNMDQILEEMMLPVRFYDKRGAFLGFFRKHISAIREEMQAEFTNDVTTEEFDLFFRKAISHYEGIH